jgi:hypothetical protein
VKLPAIPAASFAALLLTAQSPAATPSLCDSISGNIVNNCGFEGSTFLQNGATVPSGWTENGAYDANPSFNLVIASPNSGTANLSIGNFDNQPVPAIRQTLSDIAGDKYLGAIYIDYFGCCDDPGAFFDVLIDNSTVLALNAADTTATWLPYTFSFTATGTDILTIQANTSPEEWYVDDVIVDPAPEPAVYLLTGSGLLALAIAKGRLSR